MFLQVCVCPQGDRVSASVHAGMPYPPGSGRHPPDQVDTPQDQTDTPQDQADTPRDQADTPQDQADPPDQADPLDQADPPGTRQTPPWTRQTPQTRQTPPRPGRAPGTRQTPPWDQADTPPGKQTPAYGLRAASTHPTGMHSCLFEKILNILFFALSHISGRTIKDFLMYTLTIPCLYSFLWFSVFGGVGVKMENLARQAHLTCDSPLGGAKSTESFNGLYLLSCRY